MTEEVWRERDTTPSRIEAALRNLLIERYHDEDAFVPARVLNLVVVPLLMALTVGGFVSLWCFWAAIVSVVIDLHLRRAAAQPRAERINA